MLAIVSVAVCGGEYGGKDIKLGSSSCS